MTKKSPGSNRNKNANPAPSRQRSPSKRSARMKAKASPEKPSRTTRSHKLGLGTELAAIFSGAGLDHDIPELRGQLLLPPKL
jgi:hypothetical protein